MSNENDINWQQIGAQLRAPFEPSDVDFRVQGRVNEQTGKGQVVAYIDARSVQDRLDDVVGPGNWAFEWEPVVVDKGDVQVAKGTLTLYGVSKSDVGTASNFEASLGAVSHCFKRAAVHFGIGRYLYGISSAYVQIEKGGRISDETLRGLRARLPRPDGAQPAPATAAAMQQATYTTGARNSETKTANISAPTTKFAARPPTIHAPADEPIAKIVASAEEQQKLVEALRAAGHNTSAKAAAMLLAVLGRTINIADLIINESDITVAEVAKVQQELTAVGGKR